MDLSGARPTVEFIEPSSRKPPLPKLYNRELFRKQNQLPSYIHPTTLRHKKAIE